MDNWKAAIKYEQEQIHPAVAVFVYVYVFMSLKNKQNSKALGLEAVNDYRGCFLVGGEHREVELESMTCTKHWRYPALDDDWCRPCLPRETGDWLMFLV